ncbi:hypothetical protein B296_00038803 [Ensete ventricosum]|uniref:Uncharacterized protein n=1 Tax=Ensete ventricosum TaxID=4639 RepID=A0A426X5S2_ENSVE|nr:hypothetical protein B296_00038803 [Ensete ventricosum]
MTRRSEGGEEAGPVEHAECVELASDAFEVGQVGGATGGGGDGGGGRGGERREGAADADVADDVGGQPELAVLQIGERVKLDIAARKLVKGHHGNLACAREESSGERLFVVPVRGSGAQNEAEEVSGGEKDFCYTDSRFHPTPRVCIPWKAVMYMATAPAAEGSRGPAHVDEYEFGPSDLEQVEASRSESACNGTYAALFGANGNRRLGVEAGVGVGTVSVRHARRNQSHVTRVGPLPRVRINGGYAGASWLVSK